MNTSGNLPRASVQGIFFSVASIIVGGLLIGALVSIISNFIYFILLFPVGMGIAAATIIERTIRANKIRIPAWGIAFGILAGFVIYGTFHFGNYLSFLTCPNNMYQRLC